MSSSFRSPVGNAPRGELVFAASAAILVAGFIAAIFVTLFAAGAQQGAAGTAPTGIWSLFAITIKQASLSTLAAIAIGIALAWALDRTRFPGRNFVIGFLTIGIVAPAISIALGVLNIWGRSGWIADMFTLLGLNIPVTPFGLHGVILAHMTLSGTLATRVFFNLFQAVPSNTLKLAHSLNLSPISRLRAIDLPLVINALPGLASLIFLANFTSFPVVLILGGGPSVSSFELAIYQAARQNFDLAQSASLALIQLAACAALIVPMLLFSPHLSGGRSHQSYHLPDSKLSRALAVIILIICLPLVTGPIITPLLSLTSPELMQSLLAPRFHQALLTSLMIAFGAASLVTGLALLMASARANLPRTLGYSLLLFPAYAYLAMPAVVMSLGSFLIVRQTNIPLVSAAPFVIMLGNILMTLPFALAILSPPVGEISKRYQRLGQSLQLGWKDRLMWVEVPLLRTDLAFVFALAFCFSMGDLGIVSMFGTDQIQTLPWLIARSLGAYRTDESGIYTAILLIICFISFISLPALLSGQKRSGAANA